jgi:hypothetical protein
MLVAASCEVSMPASPAIDLKQLELSSIDFLVIRFPLVIFTEAIFLPERIV